MGKKVLYREYDNEGNLIKKNLKKFWIFYISNLYLLKYKAVSLSNL